MKTKKKTGCFFDGAFLWAVIAVWAFVFACFAVSDGGDKTGLPFALAVALAILMRLVVPRSVCDWVNEAFTRVKTKGEKRLVEIKKKAIIRASRWHLFFFAVDILLQVPFAVQSFMIGRWGFGVLFVCTITIGVLPMFAVCSDARSGLAELGVKLKTRISSRKGGGDCE